jgi:hypothetical protein
MDPPEMLLLESLPEDVLATLEVRNAWRRSISDADADADADADDVLVFADFFYKSAPA